jgi:hypothetical protein
MRTRHSNKITNLLLRRLRQSISVIRIQSKHFIAERAQVGIFSFVTCLDLWQFMMVCAIRLYYQMAFGQAKVASITANRMLFDVFNLEYIEDMSHRFFNRGSFCAFEFATARTVGIFPSPYIDWLCQKCLVANGTLFIESAIKCLRMASVRAEFEGQIRRWLTSRLKGFSATFALAHCANVMRLPIKSLAFWGAKMLCVLFRVGRAYFIDDAALRTGNRRSAMSVKALATAKVLVSDAFVARPCLELFAASGANNFSHKKRLLSLTVGTLAKGAQPMTEGRHNYNFVRSNRQATASLSHSIIARLQVCV